MDSRYNEMNNIYDRDLRISDSNCLSALVPSPSMTTPINSGLSAKEKGNFIFVEFSGDEDEGDHDNDEDHEHEQHEHDAVSPKGNRFKFESEDEYELEDEDEDDLKTPEADDVDADLAEITEHMLVQKYSQNEDIYFDKAVETASNDKVLLIDSNGLSSGVYE